MTTKEAREKIRNHLDNRSTHSVEVTERMARYWWRVCNVALFNEKLYPPKTILIKQLADWGYCQVSSNKELTIALDTDIPKRELFLSTLIHEMVHQWEHETHGRMGHGKRYRKWVDRVSNYIGLDIHSDYDEDDYTYGEKLYKRRH
jgi:hypothetical protein